MHLTATKKAKGEVPPPSYEESTAQPLPASNGEAPTQPPQSHHRLQKPAQPSVPQPNRQFPTTFNLYKQGSFSRLYLLGAHQDQPLYAVRPHTGWSGEPNIVLHNGPGENFPPLATVNNDNWHRSLEVSLPPLPGVGASTEKVHASGFAHHAYDFSVHVNKPGGQGYVYEAFEWRRSSGDAVGQLGGRSHGWKLVRLTKNVLPGGGGGETTSDGREVVAVCTQNAFSMSKVWRFEFIGTGASGVLGERFAVMAVITALGIWDRENKRKRSSAAGASAGSAA